MRAEFVLIDTSVWVEHLRRGSRLLTRLLEDGAVACHPFVIGELACRSLQNRDEILGLLGELPQVPTLTHHEAMGLIDRHRLWSRGIGWIDIHLLGSSMLAKARLYTADRRLAAVAAELGLTM